MLEHIFKLISDKIGSDVIKYIDLYDSADINKKEAFSTPALMIEFRPVALENYLDKMQGTTMDIVLHIYVDEIEGYSNKSTLNSLRIIDVVHRKLEGARKTDVMIQNSPITRMNFSIGKEGSLRHIRITYRTYVWDSSLSEEFGVIDDAATNVEAEFESNQ